ncbi:MAG: replication-associated recombination protein A [Candidatus Aureabacteria bacterium]|nr:replication-associated recombination protein A [Candidatus Auribacterota bacterium]
MDLFDTAAQDTAHAPLAARMRPRTLEEFEGQTHILGKGKLLSRAIESDRIGSIILWGPPGTGKTTLAEVTANATHSCFERMSAVMANVDILRRAIYSAENRLRERGEKTIIFIDEIHRFNKAQQDVLLPHVERATISLIGATTHNPCFYVNAPLLSRSLLFELRPLGREELRVIIDRALADPERGLGKTSVIVDDPAMEHILAISDGDARRALNAIERAVLTTPPGKDGSAHVTLGVAEDSVQSKAVVYDRDEDGHYDTISAFIKSMRGCDPDAALYWMAKMIHAGEDPRFIARRIIICAAEDVGNADPHALLVATAAMQAVEFVGMPEARIPLAQAAIYVACAPKSNASYSGIEKALEGVRTRPTMEVPDAIKGTGYAGAGRLGRGKGYTYAHGPQSLTGAPDLTPEPVSFYKPWASGYERVIKRRLELWRRKGKGRAEAEANAAGKRH